MATNRTKVCRCVPVALLCCHGLALPHASAERLPIVPVGALTFIDNSNSADRGLSGLTYATGSTFYAIGDHGSRVFQLDIDIDSQTGAIQSAAVITPPLQLRDPTGTALADADYEALAFAGSSVFVVNQTVPTISRHDMVTGNQLGKTSLDSDLHLKVFAQAVPDRGWASLARQRDGSTLWTANEEALTVDGALSTTVSGTIVRLQKLDGDLNPVGQWAYLTDPISGNPGADGNRGGVVGLVALDDGRLLVMERSQGYGIRLRIYLVDPASGTDISSESIDTDLAQQNFTLVTKTRLFQSSFLLRNFEDITLGPTLADGSQSLILIADNDEGAQLTLYALKLGVPEPCTAILMSLLALPVLRRRYAGRG